MSDDDSGSHTLETGEPVTAEDEGPAESSNSRRRATAKKGSLFRELPVLIVVAFVLALLIKAFLVQPFYIPSGSMQQTLELRDRVLVNKLIYDFRDIRRGEVVVFNGLDSFTPETVVEESTSPLGRVRRGLGNAIGVGTPGEKDFIKRVIGVPGDRVSCCTDGNVTVQPRGAAQPLVLREPYIFENSPEGDRAFCAAGAGDANCPPDSPPIVVPEGRLFVMGDHRGASADSREHINDPNGFEGTVPQDKVIGRAFVIVWPFDRARLLTVPDTFDGALSAVGPAVAATPYALGVVGALPIVAMRRRRRARR